MNLSFLSIIPHIVQVCNFLCVRILVIYLQITAVTSYKAKIKINIGGNRSNNESYTTPTIITKSRRLNFNSSFPFYSYYSCMLLPREVEVSFHGMKIDNSIWDQMLAV